MAEEKPKFKFLRKIDDLKDIIENSDAKSKIFYLKSLEKIVSTRGFFVDGNGPESFSIKDGVIVAPANLRSLQKGEINIDRNRYYSYIFPSEFVKSLVDLAKIFVKKDQTLSQYIEEDLELVKKLGDYDRTNNVVDETAYIRHIDEIEILRKLIVDAFQKNPNFIQDENEDELLVGAKAQEDEDKNDKDEKSDGGQKANDPNVDDIDDKARLKTAVVAGAILKQTNKVLQANDISPEIKQKIQYETGWLYNRAIYEMFTAHGIDKTNVDPNVLEKLRLDIFDFTSRMDEKQLFAMLGSASQRQTALLRFYPKFASQNKGILEEYYKRLTNSPAFQNLDLKQKEEFNKFNKNLLGETISELTSPTELLRQSLMTAVGSDSEKLNKNVQNTLDAMILQYGIDQEYFAQDENGKVVLVKGNKNEHDVINILKNMDDEKIKIIFDLPGSTTSKEIRQLKEVLYNYTNYRASELTLHVMDTSLSRGLMKVSDDEAKKLAIKGSGAETIHRDVLTSTRSAIEKNGAETVAGGLDNKNENSRKKDKISKITKQYKTFIPLWTNLSAEEQRIIYNKFDLPYQKGNKDEKLQFIPEFLFFDISTLNTFKNIRDAEKMTADEQVAALKLYEKLDREQLIKDVEELKSLDFIALGNQLAEEKKYGQFLQDSYIYNTEIEQQLLMADFVNDGTAIESEITYVSSGGGDGKYPRLNYGYFDEYSPRELMEFDQHIQDSDYDFSEPNQGFSRFGRISGRLKNSKAYKSLAKRFGGNKLNPAKKMAGALGKSAASKVFNNIAKAASVALPGAGKVLYEIGNKIGFKRAGAIIGSLLALLIAKTIHALSTLGGFIGGAIGGTIGFIIAGGPVGIVPGVIVGANAGALVNSTPLVSSVFGNNASLPAAEAALTNSSANTAALKTASQGALLNAAAADVFFGVPIAILAPSLAMFIGIAVTIHTVFTIQSAFLIPIPTNLSALGGGLILGDGGLILGDLACFELMPGGATQTIVFDEGGSVTLTSLDWDQASIDLVKAGFASVAGNAKFIELLCTDGPIALYKYPPSPQDYYGWTIDSNNMILYEGAFGDVGNMEYLMIHESGHILDGRNPDLLSEYNQMKTSLSCYTYPAGCTDGEAFAEGLALTIIQDRFPGNEVFPAGSWPFSSDFGTEYQWFRNRIFGE